jgi:hypothetical protein
MSTSSPSPDDLAQVLAAAEHRSQVDAAESGAAASGGHTRTYDLAAVARAAMHETARLAQLERELAAGTPMVAARLRVIGDMAAVCLAEVAVNATARAMLDEHGRAQA